MKKADLISEMAKSANVSPDQAKSVLHALTETIYRELKAKKEFTIPGLAKVSVKHRPAKTGRNPATGAAIQIAARDVPHFSAVKALKDAVSA